MYIDSFIPSAHRDFYHPQPLEETIRESVGRFLAAIDRSLRVKCYRDTTLRIPFSHAVFRYLFRDKTKLTLRDFSSTYFPSGWDQCYRRFGSDASRNPLWRGRCIVFPLDVKCVLRSSKRSSFIKQDSTYVPKPVVLEEIIRVCITKINCNS